MKAKTTIGKSPRRPVTKEVFPYEQERKKTAGTIMHKPTSAHGSRASKASLTKEDSKSLLAQGTTVKGTPKVTSTKKDTTKFKENMSTNRLKNSQAVKTTKSKPKLNKKSEVSQRIAAITIQRWWRGILEEQERLRQKLIAARQALNELKKKRMTKEQESAGSPSKHSEQDLSIANVDSPSNKRIIDIQNSDSKRDSEVLQTA